MHTTPNNNPQQHAPGIAGALAEGRILILDGAMGTMLQRAGLGEADFSRGATAGRGRTLKGDNECLNLTRPDVVRRIHDEYIAAGADIIETNTFGANSVAQAEYGCADLACDMALEGARIARRAADEAKEEILQKRSIQEYRIAQYNLARAMSRLRVRSDFESWRK